MRMRFVGANPAPAMTGLDRLAGNSHYFLGRDPGAWRADVPSFARVSYEDIYPGIDLIFHGRARSLEYDFVVSPGADPRAIRLAFQGDCDVTLARDGSLMMTDGGSWIVHRAPVAYQSVGAVRQEVPGAYVMLGDGVVGFRIGDYDPALPLVIDPVLSYSSYLGGDNLENGHAVAVDSEGHIYAAGATASVNFPTTDPLQDHFAGFVDAFVTKMSADGSTLIYSTFLGGRAADQILAMAVDDEGRVSVTGFTGSAEFPAVRGIQDHLRGTFDGFVARLSPAGDALEYSTYLGGSGWDQSSGIALDKDGSALVAGATNSIDFPTVLPMQPAYGGGFFDAFVTKIGPSGTSFVYSTFLGGESDDSVEDIVVDSRGASYVTGSTRSTAFPVSHAMQPALRGYFDAFVAKLAPAGSSMVFATYLGGSGSDGGYGIALDRAGSVLLTGRTTSSDFPTVNPFQAQRAALDDAFVARMSPDGSSLEFSTYLGGGAYASYNVSGDFGAAIRAGPAGHAIVAGVTNSTDFPTRNPIQERLGGGVCGFEPRGPIFCQDIFVAEFDRNGSLVYSTYLGGSHRDSDPALAVDRFGDVTVTGFTYSTDFPLVDPIQPAFGGGPYDAFVSRISEPNMPPVATCRDMALAADDSCQALADVDNGSFDPEGRPITLIQNPAGPYGLGETPVTLTATDVSRRLELLHGRGDGDRHDTARDGRDPGPGHALAAEPSDDRRSGLGQCQRCLRHGESRPRVSHQQRGRRRVRRRPDCQRRSGRRAGNRRSGVQAARGTSGQWRRSRLHCRLQGDRPRGQLHSRCRLRLRPP